MQICQCEAIVLGVMDYRESDRIVTLFTLEYGKLKGIAPGARKSIRRFSGSLEPFAHLHLHISLKEGLSRVHSADAVTVFPHIRRELAKIAHAGYACELTERLVPEGAHTPRLFRLLAAYLHQLDSAPFLPSDRRFFEVNLLNILGYRPVLDHCASCGSDLAAASPLHYAAAAGGLVCASCGGASPDISPEAVALLGRSLRSGRFGAVLFPPSALREAGGLLDSVLALHLDHPLKSLAFLSELGGETGGNG